MISRKLCLAVMVVVAFGFGAYCFGGPVPEEPKSEPSPAIVQAAPAAQPAETAQATTPVNDRVTELDKVRAEMKMEKAELQKLEKTLWLLDTRQANARKKGDSAKLLQLKEQEQDVIEKARLVKASIARRLEKYPELKVSEAIEKSSAAKPAETAVMPAGVSPAPAIQTETVTLPVPPVAAAKPRPASAGVVIHVVQPGDTLYSVSRKYFNTPTLYKEIARMNNLLPTEGLYVGERLKIDLNLKGLITKKPVVRTQPRPAEEIPQSVEDLPKPVDEDLNL